MKNSILRMSSIFLLLACGSGSDVKVHRPLGGFPDEPSTVRAVVLSLDVSIGMMRVNVRTVNGNKWERGDTVWIDESTIFSNSGGGPDLRTWEQLTGAEVEIKGWYREDRYYADEIDVVGVPRSFERALEPPIRPTPTPLKRP